MFSYVFGLKGIFPWGHPRSVYDLVTFEACLGPPVWMRTTRLLGFILWANWYKSVNVSKHDCMAPLFFGFQMRPTDNEIVLTWRAIVSVMTISWVVCLWNTWITWPICGGQQPLYCVRNVKQFLLEANIRNISNFCSNSLDPTFISSSFIPSEEKIYFFFSEVGKEYDFIDKFIVSRVAQICTVRRSVEVSWWGETMV